MNIYLPEAGPGGTILDVCVGGPGGGPAGVT